MHNAIPKPFVSGGFSTQNINNFIILAHLLNVNKNAPCLNLLTFSSVEIKGPDSMSNA